MRAHLLRKARATADPKMNAVVERLKRLQALPEEEKQKIRDDYAKRTGRPLLPSVQLGVRDNAVVLSFPEGELELTAEQAIEMGRDMAQFGRELLAGGKTAVVETAGGWPVGEPR